jgi:hypothetical protein
MRARAANARAARAKQSTSLHHYLYVPLVRLAPRPSEVAPKQTHLATMIASPSTTLAPTPRRQRLTTVGGWCETNIRPFPSRFHPGVFAFMRFCDTKRLDGKLGMLGSKPAVNTPQSGHRSAP